VNEFVEECRREWKRLHVPDPIANEMAADLEADLAEAEAEGASAEEVLGSGAFDPRSFAASWAAERGVVQPQVAIVSQPTPRARPRRRLGVLAVFGGSALVGLVVLVSAALAFGRVRTSQAIAAPVIRRVPFPPVPRGRVGPLSVHSASFGAPIGAIAMLVVLVLVVGTIGLILTLFLWRRPWDNAGWSRLCHDRDRTPENHYS
jgi:hypothetical protein